MTWRGTESEERRLRAVAWTRPLVGAEPESTTSSWQLHFPGVQGRELPSLGDHVHPVERSFWADPNLDAWRFDNAVEEAIEGGADTLGLVGEGWDEAALLALVTRCQRLVSSRNDASRGSMFDAVLSVHASLYDRAKPLVRADYRHALDTWQWLLRLERHASVALQIAALFHDIERLVSEPDVRVEQHAADYRTYKEQHASQGGEMVLGVLRQVGCPDNVCTRVAELVSHHETPDGESELALLNDADALSFFSLNSDGFFGYYGAAHTQKKVAYTLGRMRPSAARLLPTVRLRGEVKQMLAAVSRDRSYGSAA